MSIFRQSSAKYAVLCLLLLTGVGAHRLATRTPTDSTAYHARVKAEVERIPFIVGEWAGEKMDVPPSAVALLRPNGLAGRSYRNESGDRVITLAVVQCRDTRDMTGHYPPLCYPANGWKLLQTERLEMSLDDKTTLPVTRYLFDRSTALETVQRWVYNLLILPIEGGVKDMDEVREAASNHQDRQRGAAQIQLVLSGDVLEADQKRFVLQFLTKLQPVVKEIIQFEPSPGQ
jgi:hypothetical protein